MRTSSDAPIVVSAPSKINLYLGIHTEKDERGYHRVDSVMAALDLADTLHIEPANELVVLTEPAVDVPMERNTAYRAAVELACAFGLEPRVRIAIEKRIPAAGGARRSFCRCCGDARGLVQAVGNGRARRAGG